MLLVQCSLDVSSETPSSSSFPSFSLLAVGGELLGGLGGDDLLLEHLVAVEAGRLHLGLGRRAGAPHGRRGLGRGGQNGLLSK